METKSNEETLSKEERFNLAISYRVKAYLLDLNITAERRAESFKLDINEINDMLLCKKPWSVYVLSQLVGSRHPVFAFFAFGLTKANGSV